MKKKIFIILSVLLVAAIVYFINAFFGNPISKAKAEKEVLAYYEEKYHKDFEVYSSQYNFLIPDYNIKMRPTDDKDAVFETSRYELTMFDAYGAYLASMELESKIRRILDEKYPNLKYSLKVQEEHNIGVAGIVFDFFSPDPQTRLEKNFFIAELSWKRTGLNNEKTFELMDEIAASISSELNGIPKQFSMDIYVKDSKNEKNSLQRHYLDGMDRGWKVEN
ncbi:hypothetical protein [Bacillus sp. T3]|uniref:YfjL-like protein n=1 Tax=Bacillus sp. T3 TaxID=467262 RepID=UPI002980B6A1|nr:hypothetical protein [Bacillus sp. T3]